jgi:cell wall-associated NlpC family hydrolase
MSALLSMRHIRRAVAAVLCLGLVAFALAPSPAQAQDIDSLRERAAQLADKLEDLEREQMVADEEYLGTVESLESLYTQINTTKEEITAAQGRVDEATSQANSFLVTAYMDAGSNSSLAVLQTSDLDDSLNQQVLLDTLRGDREELADELAASRADLDDRQADLESQQADVKAVEAEQAAAKERLEAAVAEAESLYDSANAELQQALEEERRRREEEAARRAAEEAAAREAAQAQAAAEAAARQPQAQTRSAGSAATATGPASSGTTAPAPAPASPSPSAAPAPAPPPPPPPAPVSGGAAGAIQAAKSQLGRMYRYGGSSPATGFDCSGLMMWSWAQVGVGLPRTSRAQKSATQPVPMSQIQPGDLVFYGSPVYHVGMYVGGGMIIDSPRTGKPVQIRSIGLMGRVSGVGRVR